MVKDKSKDVEMLCKWYKIITWSLNDDLSIDVPKSVDLWNRELSVLPIKFRNVYGDFNCAYNDLTSLHNFPIYINGCLSIKFNKFEKRQSMSTLSVTGKILSNCLWKF